MGTEPIEEEIPIDMQDFHPFVQTCFAMYSKLPDVWDYMGGNYCGKNNIILFELFRLNGLDSNSEQLLAMDILAEMDKVRSGIISNNIKSKNKPAK